MHPLGLLDPIFTIAEDIPNLNEKAFMWHVLQMLMSHHK